MAPPCYARHFMSEASQSGPLDSYRLVWEAGFDSITLREELSMHTFGFHCNPLSQITLLFACYSSGTLLYFHASPEIEIFSLFPVEYICPAV